MPQGLQVFNSQGQLVLDVTDRLTKVIGVLSTTTEDGGQAIPVPPWGQVWIQMLSPSGDDFFAVPRVFYQDGAIHWRFTDNPYNVPPSFFRRATQITYGVY